jgi:2,3-bisphosphoglycerate-independent phosphoglycerate mutase
MVHFKGADDAAHDRNVAYRVAYLEAADALLRQLLARLWAHEAAGGAHYVVCVTGDHSTPVLYGDHSNEPVPVAAAHLADAVVAMGGADVAQATPLGPIRTPEFSPPGSDTADAARAAREARSPAGAVAGDAVWRFDELAAGAGGLGRFCGEGLMPLLRAFRHTQAETDGAAPRTQ